MKRAHQHREYRNVHAFQAPDGIVTADIDDETGELATPGCPRDKVRTEVFIAGSQPVQICHLHGKGSRTQISSWEPVQQTPGPTQSALAAPPDLPPVVSNSPAPTVKPGRSIPVAPAPAPQPEKKKNIWQRIFGK